VAASGRSGYERVLGLQAEPKRDADQWPRRRCRPQHEPQGEVQQQHRPDLVEGDRLEEPVRGDQDRREADQQGRHRLAEPAGTELSGDQRGEHDGHAASEHRQDAKRHQ
jgi:hypothetical protein